MPPPRLAPACPGRPLRRCARLAGAVLATLIAATGGGPALAGPPSPAGASRSEAAASARTAAAPRQARAATRATARPQPAAARRAATPRSAAPRPATPRPAASRAAPARPVSPQERQAAMLGVIEAAARNAGVEPALLVAMAARESRFNAAARNPLSSATGLMQFTEAAWLEALRDHGPALGLARQAALLRTDPRTGEITTRHPRDLKHLLDLRKNARLSAKVAAARVAAQRPPLEAALGRPASAADLYALHLLGQSGARRFLAQLAARPSARAVDAVSAEAAERNRGVFFARDGRALSVAEVHAAMVRSTAEGRALLAAARGREEPVQLAEAPPGPP